MYWITDKIATSSMSEFMHRKEKGIVAVDVSDLIDGEGNNPETFKSKVNEVEDLIKRGKRVCVCCGSGLSRSNAVALAYLIKNSMSYDDAYNLIREKVPVAQIDMGLLDTIKEIYTKKF